jgi:large repetitive protein
MCRICFLLLLFLVNITAGSAAGTSILSNSVVLLPPEITGQSALQLNEDGSLTLNVSHFQISDPDSAPADFVLTVYSGTNYTVSGTTITPAPNFAGVLTVPVSVSDGAEESAIFNAQVTVNAVNDQPSITGQNSVQTNEDQAFELTVSHLIISDPDDTFPDGFTIAISAGDNYSVSGTTITPAANFSGTLSIPVSVSDGEASSNTFTVQAAVAAVNDPPVITGQSTVQSSEDTPFELNVSKLVVADVDNNSFTIAIQAGANYAVSGTTVTPAPNFNGTLSIPVTVSDGSASSNVFTVAAVITSVNDAPVITGQNPVERPEDNAFQIALSDLVISDVDNSSFTIAVSSGTNYSVSGTTVTPSANFVGTLSIPVTVSDGSASSNSFPLQVVITPVSDPPVITGQNALTTAEEQAITISLDNLLISNPDNLALTPAISAGTNYAVSGTTITPATNFNGVLSVPVSVGDGTVSSNGFNLQISVTAVNDLPVITGQGPVETPENTAITLTTSHLVISDPDNAASDFVLQVSSGDNYTIAGNIVTPAANYNGTLSVPVTVSDGTASSASFTLQITVVPVNSAPQITGQIAAVTTEDTPYNLTLDALTVVDADGNFPNGFTVSAQPGTNYTVSGTTITPAPNFNGALTIPVTVNDGQANSPAFNFKLTVSPVNDAPVITGQQTLNTLEDQALTIAMTNLLVTDVDNTYPTGFSLIISAGPNYTVEGMAILPAAQFTGGLTVPVKVSDGSATSNEFNLVINVGAVNDPPVITGQAGISVAEEGSVTFTLSHFTVVDPDNTYPEGFTLQVLGGSNYSVAGTTITPAANFTGNLTVGVTVSDGKNTSAVFNAVVNVGSVNDAPVITGQSALTINEDQALTIQLAQLTVTDSDNTYPQGFTLQLSPGSNYTVSGSSVTPKKDFNGELKVPATVNDGTSNSNIFELKITVTPVNDPPSVTGQQTLTTYKNRNITLRPEDLQITDPDSPSGSFSLAILEGQNYTFVDRTIMPAPSFLGVLTVPVTVSDGSLSSQPFSLKINVVAPPNVPPVIVGQTTLTTFENKSIVLGLGHLVVTDPDNRYPDDFKLTIWPGDHYTVSQQTIVPEKDFSGTLKVKVTVSDKESTSEPFFVSIQVVPVTDVPLITSQAFLRIHEDDSLVLNFNHLVVLDPDNTYPTGFTMNAAVGSNYTLDGMEVKPEKDFNGYLSVPVTVHDGENTSVPYQLLILVDPVNDPPVVTDTEPGDLFFDGSDLALFKSFTITDVDDDTLTYAEVTVVPPFEERIDTLMFANAGSVRGIFDKETNTLVIFGSSSIDAYQTFIRSIRYNFSGVGTPKLTKTFGVTVNDGKVSSNAAQKVVKFEEPTANLDIPSGFTPNGDGANDTWIIRASSGNEPLEDAVIRVYNKRGSLVFEGNGNQEWDGRMNGNLLPADTYFYTIDVQGIRSRSRYKGVITILR